VESRTLKLTAIGSGITFPHAELAAQIVRRRRPSTSAATGTWHTETVYAVTDLGFGDVCADQLVEIIQEHWSIETSSTDRDVTFAEDHSQIRTGNSPRSWLRYATSPSAVTASTATPTSPPPADTPAAIPFEPLTCSHKE
jgi:hypothetical protein